MITCQIGTTSNSKIYTLDPLRMTAIVYVHDVSCIHQRYNNNRLPAFTLPALYPFRSRTPHAQCSPHFFSHPYHTHAPHFNIPPVCILWHFSANTVTAWNYSAPVLIDIIPKLQLHCLSLASPHKTTLAQQPASRLAPTALLASPKHIQPHRSCLLRTSRYQIKPYVRTKLERYTYPIFSCVKLNLSAFKIVQFKF